MKVSVIVATYNWKEALRTSIESLFDQSRMLDEIIVADDGSRDDTRLTIDELRKNAPVPLIHVWQPDCGFRLAMSRNKGILHSTGDYLIFLDGDCFVNRRFVEDHLSLARANQFIAGTRVNITKVRQEYIQKTGDRQISFFSSGIRKRFNAIRSPWLAKLYYHGTGFAGANFSLWREDLYKINGFDEWYVGYGGEDTDLALRLENAGVKKRRMVHLGMAYHYAHRVGVGALDKEVSPIGLRLQDIRRTQRFRCEAGLVKEEIPGVDRQSLKGRICSDCG